MNQIVGKEYLSDKIIKFEIRNKYIAQNALAGNFVIVKLGEFGERIPLTVCQTNTQEETISLVIQNVGVSSDKLCRLEVGDKVTDVVGPLGHETEIKNYGTVLAAGGGVGTAPLLPIIKAMKEAGNKVISVIAGRSKELVILEKEVREYSDEVIVMTDDGSHGTKGLVTEGMEKAIVEHKIDFSVVIGPAIMMKFASLVTKKHEIPTIASLNTIMVDGTGMCGACRVSIAGKTKFVCVDGPEFDAHQVDFEEMLMRLNSFKKEEQESKEHAHDHVCKAETKFNKEQKN